ncbi:MAG TPA: hypothetical protein VK843_10865 [Planctomycetota bacterium]|nr:hypothetical protein [Planctomycetota bacterium]
MLELSSAAVGLAVVSCIGRVVLSWLPPGEVGSHRLRDVPTTWAASYLLGASFLAVGASVSALARVPVSCAWIAGAALLLGLARWLTLPAALVPRHEVLREVPTRAARALLWIAVAIGVWAALGATINAGSGLWSVRAQAWLSQGWLIGFDGPATARGALELAPLDCGAIACVSWPGGIVNEVSTRAHLLACFLSAVLLIERAMELTRRAPLGRRLLLVLFAVALSVAFRADDGDLALAGLCALALLGLASWTRRADARGLALACIAWGSLSLLRPGGWVLAIAGLGATVGSSARPSRGRAALWAFASAMLLLSLWPLAAWTRDVPLLGPDGLSRLGSSWVDTSERTRLALCIGPIWILLGAALGPAVLRLARYPRNAFEDLQACDPDRTRRDLAALLLFGALLTLFTLLVVFLHREPSMVVAKTWAPGLLIQTAPWALLLSARALVRAERAT